MRARGEVLRTDAGCLPLRDIGCLHILKKRDLNQLERIGR